MYKLFVRRCLFHLFIPLSLFASFETHGHTAIQLGLSFSGIASQKSPWLVLGKSLNGNTNITLSYRNYYSIKSFGHALLHSRFKVSSIPLNAQITQYGNNLYKEINSTFSVVYPIHANLDLGLFYHFYHVDIKKYNAYAAHAVSLSMHYQPLPALGVAIFVQNLNAPTLANEKIAFKTQAGVAYLLSERIEIMVDLYKEAYWETEYRIATQILVTEQLFLLAGLRTQVESFSAGFEYKTSLFKLAYAVEMHPLLNLSQAMTVTYFF